MELALMIAHLFFSVVLIIVVLLQKSKQPGLSGAVAGGNETFFGKNKGRTVDAILKKLTSIFAILFIVTSVSLAFVATRPEETSDTPATKVEENEAPAESSQDSSEDAEPVAENAEGETDTVAE